MTEKSEGHLILKSRDDYRCALRRVAALRNHGATAESNKELAALEGAIARYAAKPGRPEWRKGRPDNGGSDAM
jgi:hypothetical protein